MIRYAAILPYAIVSGQILVLLGLERYSKDWDSFGGKLDYPEEPHDMAAVREAYEESMGLLGDEQYLLDTLDISRGIYFEDVVVYPYRIGYDAKLPIQFDAVLQYIHELNPADKKGYLEKTKIAWFSIQSLKTIPLRNPRTLYTVLHQLRHKI